MNTPMPSTGSSAPQPCRQTTSDKGRIVEWLDAKGYGWVKFRDKRIFIHIKDFEPGQRRPVAGEEVLFIQEQDSKGRLCAKNVRFAKAFRPIGMGTLLGLCLLLVLPVFALLELPFPWWQGIGWMALISWITYMLYADDKARAKSSGWRTSENKLHMAELLGGWPGALIAQRRLRHKCSKTSYQILFWCIVLLFQIVAMDVLLDQRLSRSLGAYIMQKLTQPIPHQM